MKQKHIRVVVSPHTWTAFKYGKIVWEYIRIVVKYDKNWQHLKWNDKGSHGVVPICDNSVMDDSAPMRNGEVGYQTIRIAKVEMAE